MPVALRPARTAMPLVKATERATGLTAEFAGSADASLLDQLEQACPFEIPSLCCAGACGNCAVLVTRGLDLVERDLFGIGCTQEMTGAAVVACVAGLRQASMAENPGVIEVVVG